MSKENPNEFKIINKNERLKYRQTINQLKQQLEEAQTRINELEDKDWFEATIKQLEEQNDRLIQERDNLKQQLAEKDKEIERFMSMKNKEQLVNENEALKDTIAIVLAQKRNIVKHKKQLAIQELEKTLNFIEDVFDKALKNCSLNNGYYDQILDFIDQQINELKRVKRRIK